MVVLGELRWAARGWTPEPTRHFAPLVRVVPIIACDRRCRVTASPLRVALVADLLSERWPSMNLVADMLFAHLRAAGSDQSMCVDLLRPTLSNRGERLGRYVNRFWDYSRWLRKRARDFDVFHIVDHSYAHLVHVLPAGRAVVTCHDVDAFMPLVDAQVIPTRLPKTLTRYVLSGMAKSARVTCDSLATYDEARRHNFAAADRLVVVPLGVDPALSSVPEPAADAAIDGLLGPRRTDVVDLLHVGSCIPRKRVDVLLKVLRAVRDVDPRVRLLKAGGSLTREQLALARALAVDEHIVQLPFLESRLLGALYRRAAVTLVTSEREGFGLPVVEALACGTPVVATDIPVLREVGGSAAAYAPLDDTGRWREAIIACLAVHQDAVQSRRTGEDTAARFSWRSCATAMATIYADVDRRASDARVQ